MSSGDNILANMSATGSPDFYIPNLDAAQDYSTTIYSFNAKGWSKSSQPLVFHTLPAPGLKEQRRSTADPSENGKIGGGPWLYILLAAGSTLIVAGAVGAIIFAIRRFKVVRRLWYFQFEKFDF